MPPDAVVVCCTGLLQVVNRMSNGRWLRYPRTWQVFPEEVGALVWVFSLYLQGSAGAVVGVWGEI